MVEKISPQFIIKLLHINTIRQLLNDNLQSVLRLHINATADIRPTNKRTSGDFRT